MSVKLYKMDASPPARSAMMACEIFGVPVQLVDVDFGSNEQLSPEYLKKNPLHTVPVLEANNVFIHDSHAILMYLADKYGKDDSWYPKDYLQRARVNQILFFDTAILFPSLRNISYPAFMEGDRKVTEKKLNGIREALGYVEEFLSRSKYVAGDQITIADIACVANVTSLSLIMPIDPKKHPRIQAWIEELEQQPYFQKHNIPGHNEYKEILENVLDL